MPQWRGLLYKPCASVWRIYTDGFDSRCRGFSSRARFKATPHSLLIFPTNFLLYNLLLVALLLASQIFSWVTTVLV